MLIFACLIGILGSCLASFIQCISYRIENNIPLLRRRSFCENCQHSLNIIDLCPILNFIWNRARCRYCNKPLKRKYFLMECFSFILFFFIALRTSLDILPIFLILNTLLLNLFYEDFSFYSVRDLDQILFLLSILVLNFSLPIPSLLSKAITVLIFGSIFTLCYILKPSSLGFGDVIFIFIFSFSSNMFFFTRVFCISMMLAIIYIIIKGLLLKKAFHTIKIPLISFLALGFWISYIIWPWLFSPYAAI